MKYSNINRWLVYLCYSTLLLSLFAIACHAHDDHEQTGHDHAEHDDHEQTGHDHTEHDDHEQTSHDHAEHAADEHASHDDGHVAHTGPGMAVLSADESEGVVFHARALDRIGVQFTALAQLQKGAENNELVLPVGALIHSRNTSQIYGRSKDRIRPLYVQFLARQGDMVRVRVLDKQALHSQSAIVTNQAALIHLGYLEAFGASGAGHGH